MRVGYFFGGMLSLLLWKLDRRGVVSTIKGFLGYGLKHREVVDAVALVIIMVLVVIVNLIPEGEAINCMVAFSVLEITQGQNDKSIKNLRKNTTRKNLSAKERKAFYSTLLIMGKSLIGSFITPLIIIMFLGNGMAVAYGMIYFYFGEGNYKGVKKLLNVFFIIPSLIGDGFLYLVYICRNKTFKISFKGEFFQNLFYMPLLNIYILGAYIETVNFYYVECYEVVHYLRSYGRYQGKVDEVAIKDLVTIIYGVAGAAFILFIVLIKFRIRN